jgi:hypothetical protein|tara:strand:- start:219 stop:731 length:513 start_codon:yes stop_codon:yes gene_type:complete
MNNVTNKIIITIIAFSSMNFYGQNTSLSDEVIKDMKYMVEEEKLARDVYEFLDNTWNIRVFNNIKQSEQRHMEMMESLLGTNNVEYELSEENGVFFNEELQKMYNELIEKGSKSKYDALEVGKLIEVTDIKDLTEAIENTNDSKLITVYTNLLKASQNHLKAFERQLSRY